ncbi:MAG: hypothetical protein ACI87W_001999 [Halieaceae bacterium]|jgi:hypothetical protein
MLSSTPAQYALILLNLAGEHGVSSEQLLAGSTLAMEGLTGMGARVSDADFGVLVRNAQRLINDPALGLRLGQRLNLSAHAVLGQAFMTCANLAEVMQLFQRYYHLLAPDLVLSFTHDNGHMTLESVNTEADLPETFALEMITAAMRNTLAGLLGRQDLPLRFEFPYAAPAHLASYHEVPGDDLAFGTAAARWSFPLGLLQAPLPSSNPALRELYESECVRLLADLEDSADLSAHPSTAA